MQNRQNEVKIRGTIKFPENNAMLRDVDGLPIYVENFKIPKDGDSFDVN